MGQEINRTRFSEADFQQFAGKLAEETAALRSFAKAGGFTDARYVAGFELEAWLLDHAGRPNPVNEAYLRTLNDPLVVPELSRFNVELNAPPVEMGAGVLAAMEESLLTTWDKCQQVAHGMDTVLAMIGILPTIRNEDLCLANMSAMNRFDVLNAQVLQQRGGAPIRIDIEGADQLHLSRPDVMLEAATTSFQLHLQVPFEAGGPLLQRLADQLCAAAGGSGQFAAAVRPAPVAGNPRAAVRAVGRAWAAITGWLNPACGG